MEVQTNLTRKKENNMDDKEKLEEVRKLVNEEETKYADKTKIHTLRAIIGVIKEEFPSKDNFLAGEILKSVVKIVL